MFGVCDDDDGGDGVYLILVEWRDDGSCVWCY